MSGAHLLPRTRALAFAALAWERLWPALWPAVGCIGLFVALAWLDVWSAIPGWAHAAALAGFTVALPAALWRGFRGFALPGHDEVVRWLELRGRVAHRPLASVEDKLANNLADSGTRALWYAHQRRMAEAALRLRAGLPSPGLARHDPVALRMALVLLLALGLVTARSEWTARLGAAFAPDLQSASAGEPWQVALWLTPPEYTGTPPIWLDARTATPEQPVTVPEGSVLVGQFEGGTTAPRLVAGTTDAPFASAGGKTWQIEIPIVDGTRIAIMRDDQELAGWPIAIVPDTPPTVAFAKEPSETLRGATRFDYVARDDYGLAKLHAELHQAADATQTATIALPLTSPGAREATEVSFQDLSAHPWAGVQVTAQLVAEDAAGNQGRSDTVTFVLPERTFSHPVARAVIEQRKRLTIDPTRRMPVAEVLWGLTQDPDAYMDKSAITLSLSSAAARLVHDQTAEAVPAVQEQLWYTALAIEDGPLALAEQALRDLQQRILEAMASGATPEEIGQLLDELQGALNEYLQELVRQAESQMGEELAQQDEVVQAIDSGELAQMIEEARELMRSGSREAARQMLARLQEILENLKSGRVSGLNQGLDSEAAAMLQNLRQIMKGQRELLDDTYGAMQREGSLGLEDLQDRAASQESLMRGLQQFMQRLGEQGYDVPRSFGRAERSMGRAMRAFNEGEAAQAIGPQTDAMDQLQQGAQSLIDTFAQQLPDGRGRDNVGFFSAPRDPMGRPVLGQGSEDMGDVELPDKAQLQQIQDILQELYRRASDQRRPSMERDYLGRLLRRF